MANSETKRCLNCQAEFVIEPADFLFYEKIKVPPPTWCPECRLIRRLSFLDGISLRKNTCGLCGKNIISRTYSNVKDPIVYCNHCWWSDKWDPLDFGIKIDFSKPFFEQFSELIKRIPWNCTSTVESTNVNSEYCNSYSYLKNCYLLFQSDYSENCCYSAYVEHSQDCIGLFMADYCELCYEGVNLRKCSRAFFSLDCEECHDIYFSKNLVNCSYCFGCVNLRNKQYFFFNTPCSKNEYLEKIKEFDTGSYEVISKIAQRVGTFYEKHLCKFMHGRHNVNVSGDYIYESKNTLESYQVLGARDSKFCQFITLAPISDAYDMTMWGGNATRIYECMGAGGGQSDIKFCQDHWSDSTMDLQYCMRIVAPNSHLFGCIGLRNKQYCILNKQYTKEEYDELVPKIISHMNGMPYISRKSEIRSTKSETNSNDQNPKSQTREIIYRYGEFFPPELSPFCYNETIAQEYFALSEAEAESKGFRWKKPEPRNYQIDIKTDQLPDSIEDVKDDIIGKVIECQHQDKCNEQCTEAFKIIEPELQFYRRMNLPLPRLCPNCRHYQRLKQRNPLKLWKRQCMCAGKTSVNGLYNNTCSHEHGQGPCPNTFQTSYAPDRPEIVYCEACYLKEVV